MKKNKNQHRDNRQRVFNAEAVCIDMLTMPAEEAQRFIDVNRNKLGWMRQLNNVHRNSIDAARVAVQMKKALEE